MNVNIMSVVMRDMVRLAVVLQVPLVHSAKPENTVLAVRQHAKVVAREHTVPPRAHQVAVIVVKIIIARVVVLAQHVVQEKQRTVKQQQAKPVIVCAVQVTAAQTERVRHAPLVHTRHLRVILHVRHARRTQQHLAPAVQPSRHVVVMLAMVATQELVAVHVQLVVLVNIKPQEMEIVQPARQILQQLAQPVRRNRNVCVMQVIRGLQPVALAHVPYVQPALIKHRPAMATAHSHQRGIMYLEQGKNHNLHVQQALIQILLVNRRVPSVVGQIIKIKQVKHLVKHARKQKLVGQLGVVTAGPLLQAVLKPKHRLAVPVVRFRKKPQLRQHGVLLKVLLQH